MSNVVTTVPDVNGERKKDMVNYSAMMGLRVVCIFVCFFVPLMWVWVPALVAVFIPMVATISTTQRRYDVDSSVQVFNKDKELTS